MQNVAPTRILTRRSRNLVYLSALVLLIGVLLLVTGGMLHVISLVVPSNPDFEIYDAVRKLLLFAGVGVLLFGVFMIVRALTWQTDNTLADITGTELEQHLDERYIFIRNISKRAIGYVDAVLVGPPGVLVFRITDQEGVYFNDGAKWLTQKDKGDWKTVRFNPTTEAVADIKKVREYLTKKRLPEIPVFGVVVFTKDSPILQYSVQEPLVAVTYLSELSYNLSDSYFAKDRIDQDTAKEVARTLYL